MFLLIVERKNGSTILSDSKNKQKTDLVLFVYTAPFFLYHSANSFNVKKPRTCTSCYFTSGYGFKPFYVP